MAIEIKHTIDAGNLAAQISQGIQEGLSGFSGTLDNLGSSKLDNNKSIIPPTGGEDGAINQVKKVDNATSSFSERVNKLVGDFEKLSTALNTLSKNFKNADKLAGYASLPASERSSVLQELKQFEADSKKTRLDEIKERMDFYDKRRSENRNDSIARGILTGVGMGAVYQAGNWGQFAGSSAQAINAGSNSYGQFMNQYLGNQIDTTKNAINMASMGVAGAASMMFGAPGLLAGMGIAGLTNYFTGKTSEEQKAYNQLAMNQDIASYRIRAYGLSGASGKALSASGSQFGLGSNIRVPLTSLQSYMMGNNMGGFLPYAEDVMMSSRLDQMHGMSDPEKARYIKNTARLSQLTGSSITDIGASISNISAMTGGNANETLNRLYSYQLQYGGDMKSNVGKIIALLQSTGLSQASAEKLAYQYQYNEPMLQQKVAQTMVSPTNRFLANAYTEIIKNEIGTGDIEQIKKDYRDRTNRSNAGKGTSQDIVISQMEEMLFKSSNINPWVRDMGANKGVPNPNAGSIESLPMTEAQQAMADMIANALSNIPTLNINADVVNLNGNTPQPTQSTANPDARVMAASKKRIEPDYDYQIVPPIVPLSGTGNLGNNAAKRKK